jgi:hypothetical protein
MRKLIVGAFALTVASSALAMPIARLKQPDENVIAVRHACGAGYAHGQWRLRENSRPPCRQQMCPRSDLLV